MSRPTLVTGGTGFAGSHLLDLLSLQGADIVAWARPGGARPRVVRGVEWDDVDVRDREQVRAAIRTIKPLRVYHCAGAAHVGESWDQVTHALESNVRGTHDLIEALRGEAPDARVLIPSSGLVYAPSAHAVHEDHPRVPASPYGLSKLAQEMTAGDNHGGPQVFVARPFNHIGPRQSPAFSSASFARRIAQIEAGVGPREVSVGNLEPVRDIADVRDTVRAYTMILERGQAGRAYNVCTGRGTSVRAVLEGLLARARVDITIVTDPSRYRTNDLAHAVGDPARIRQEIGWTPEIPLERTLDELLEYWRDQVART
jgi:GDP-4-dehydro-6-deoxy-D-mannose reductase